MISDVHRAAGAHITCVKNFSTYLWGPDEVEVMKAVGNSKGRDVYGDVTVLASDPKHHKVAACTKNMAVLPLEKHLKLWLLHQGQVHVQVQRLSYGRSIPIQL